MKPRETFPSRVSLGNTAVHAARSRHTQNSGYFLAPFPFSVNGATILTATQA